MNDSVRLRRWLEFCNGKYCYFLSFSETSGKAMQRNWPEENARTRRIEEFQRKQYLERVAFIVFLLAGTNQPIERQGWMKKCTDWLEMIILIVLKKKCVNLTTHAQLYFMYPKFGTSSKVRARVNIVMSGCLDMRMQISS